MLSWYCLYLANDPGFNRKVKARRITFEVFRCLAEFTSVLSVLFAGWLTHFGSWSSPEHVTLAAICWQIEQINLVHGLEMGVIGQFPDDLFVPCDFKCLWLFAQEVAGKVIADNSVSVRQPLATGWQSQRISRHLIFVELPDG